MSVDPILIVQNLCTLYPHKGELEYPLIQKLLFIAEHQAAEEFAVRLTTLAWKFGELGPWSADLQKAVKQERGRRLGFSTYFSPLGEKRERIESLVPAPALVHPANKVLHGVISTTASLHWNDLCRMVFGMTACRETSPREIIRFEKLFSTRA